MSFSVFSFFVAFHTRPPVPGKKKSTGRFKKKNKKVESWMDSPDSIRCSKIRNSRHVFRIIKWDIDAWWNNKRGRGGRCIIAEEWGRGEEGDEWKASNTKTQHSLPLPLYSHTLPISIHIYIAYTCTLRPNKKKKKIEPMANRFVSLGEKNQTHALAPCYNHSSLLPASCHPW